MLWLVLAEVSKKGMSWLRASCSPMLLPTALFASKSHLLPISSRCTSEEACWRGREWRKRKERKRRVGRTYQLHKKCWLWSFLGATGHVSSWSHRCTLTNFHSLQHSHIHSLSECSPGTFGFEQMIHDLWCHKPEWHPVGSVNTRLCVVRRLVTLYVPQSPPNMSTNPLEWS